MKLPGERDNGFDLPQEAPRSEVEEMAVVHLTSEGLTADCGLGPPKMSINPVHPWVLYHNLQNFQLKCKV